MVCVEFVIWSICLTFYVSKMLHVLLLCFVVTLIIVKCKRMKRAKCSPRVSTMLPHVVRTHIRPPIVRSRAYMYVRPLLCLANVSPNLKSLFTPRMLYVLLLSCVVILFCVTHLHMTYVICLPRFFRMTPMVYIYVHTSIVRVHICMFDLCFPQFVCFSWPADRQVRSDCS